MNSVKTKMTFLISIIIFSVEKNKLLDLCLCNSRDVCQLNGIKSVGRNLSLAKFCFDSHCWKD